MKEVAALVPSLLVPPENGAAGNFLGLEDRGPETKPRFPDERVRAVYRLNLKNGTWRIDLVNVKGVKVGTIPVFGRGAPGAWDRMRWIDIYV